MHIFRFIPFRFPFRFPFRVLVTPSSFRYELRSTLRIRFLWHSVVFGSPPCYPFTVFKGHVVLHICIQIIKQTMLIKTKPIFLFYFYIYNNISGIIMAVEWDVTWCPVSTITTPLARNGLKSRLVRAAKETSKLQDWSLLTNSCSRYMAEILPIRRETLSNQSIWHNYLIKQKVYYNYLQWL